MEAKLVAKLDLTVTRMNGFTHGSGSCEFHGKQMDKAYVLAHAMKALELDTDDVCDLLTVLQAIRINKSKDERNLFVRMAMDEKEG